MGPKEYRDIMLLAEDEMTGIMVELSLNKIPKEEIQNAMAKLDHFTQKVNVR